MNNNNVIADGEEPEEVSGGPAAEEREAEAASAAVKSYTNEDGNQRTVILSKDSSSHQYSSSHSILQQQLSSRAEIKLGEGRMAPAGYELRNETKEGSRSVVQIGPSAGRDEGAQNDGEQQPQKKRLQQHYAQRRVPTGQGATAWANKLEPGSGGVPGERFRQFEQMLQDPEGMQAGSEPALAGVYGEVVHPAETTLQLQETPPPHEPDALQGQPSKAGRQGHARGGSIDPSGRSAKNAPNPGMTRAGSESISADNQRGSIWHNRKFYNVPQLKVVTQTKSGLRLDSAGSRKAQGIKGTQEDERPIQGGPARRSQQLRTSRTNASQSIYNLNQNLHYPGTQKITGENLQMPSSQYKNAKTARVVSAGPKKAYNKVASRNFAAKFSTHCAQGAQYIPPSAYAAIEHESRTEGGDQISQRIRRDPTSNGTRFEVHTTILPKTGKQTEIDTLTSSRLNAGKEAMVRMTLRSKLLGADQLMNDLKTVKSLPGGKGPTIYSGRRAGDTKNQDIYALQGQPESQRKHTLRNQETDTSAADEASASNRLKLNPPEARIGSERQLGQLAPFDSQKQLATDDLNTQDGTSSYDHDKNPSALGEKRLAAQKPYNHSGKVQIFQPNNAQLPDREQSRSHYNILKNTLSDSKKAPPEAIELRGSLQVTSRAKPFRAAGSDQIIGYHMVTEGKQGETYIYENQGLATGRMYPINLEKPLRCKTSKSQIPTDLWAELSLKEQFQKHLKQESEDGVKNTMSQREKFKIYHQSLMNHQVFENANEEDHAVKQPGSGPQKDGIEFQVSELIRDYSAPDTAAPNAAARKEAKLADLFKANLKSHVEGEVYFQSNQILFGQPRSDEEWLAYQKRFNGLVNEMIENMSMFDENLKLKLQMNLDLICQDQMIWQDQAETFKKSALESRKAQQQRRLDSRRGPGAGWSAIDDDEDTLKPAFIRNSDQTLKNLVEKMQKIVARFQIKPFHQALKPIQSRLNMQTNLYAIRDERAAQIDDLKEVSDCLRKVMQKQSVSWIKHKCDGAVQTSPKAKESTKALPRARQLSIVQQSSGSPAKSPALPADDPLSDEKRREARQQEQFDAFNCNQVLQLTSLYLLSVVNKYMEMQELSQTRQRILNQRQNQTYREEVDARFEKLNMLHELEVERGEKELKKLAKQLEDSRKEQRRLQTVVNDKEEEIGLLLQSGEEFPKVRRLLRDLDDQLEEFEEQTRQRHKNQDMFKSLIKVVEDVQQRKALLQQIDLDSAKKGSRKKRGLGRSASSASNQLKLQSSSLGSRERKTTVNNAGGPELSSAVQKGNVESPLQHDVRSALEYATYRRYNAAKKNLTKDQSQDGRDSGLNEAGGSVMDEGSIAEESDENEEESSSGSSERGAPVQLSKPAGRKPSPVKGKQVVSVKNSTLTCPFCHKNITLSPDGSIRDQPLEDSKKKPARSPKGKAAAAKKKEQSSSASPGRKPAKEQSETPTPQPVIKPVGQERSPPPKLAVADDDDQEEMGWDTPKSNEKRGGDAFTLQPWAQDDKKEEEEFADAKKDPSAQPPKANRNPDSKGASKGQSSKKGGRRAKALKNTEAEASAPVEAKEHPAQSPLFNERIKESERKAAASGHLNQNEYQKKVDQQQQTRLGGRLRKISVHSASSKQTHLLFGQESTSGRAPNDAENILNLQNTERTEEEVAPSDPRATNSSIKSLPDTAILRLIEVAMEEALLFECKHKPLDILTDQPFRNRLTFRIQMQNFLLTQYGLPSMVESYMNEILARIATYARSESFKFAQVIHWILQDLDRRVARPIAQSMAHCFDSSPLQGLHLSRWKLQKQRVGIYSILLFTDARTKLSSIQDVLTHGGQEVSLFEITSLISKYLPLNGLSLQILENLRPAYFDDLKEEELELGHLQFARMKVTAKLQKMCFDRNAFFDFLDSAMKNTIKLGKLFGDLAEKLQIFFSVQEQVAIRNGLFPYQRSEDVVSSRQRLVTLREDERSQSQGRSFEQVMFLSEIKYAQNLEEYMIRKVDFVEYVMMQWVQYVTILHSEIVSSFKKYDQYFNRGGLNIEQFMRLIQDDLQLNFMACFGSKKGDRQQGLSALDSDPAAPSRQDLQRCFNAALQNIEKNELIRSIGLLSLDSVVEIIIEHNQDILPFTGYIQSRFKNSPN